MKGDRKHIYLVKTQAGPPHNYTFRKENLATERAEKMRGQVVKFKWDFSPLPGRRAPS